MSNIKLFGNPRRRPLSGYQTQDGQRFLIIGPTPKPAHNVQYARQNGESGWLQFECRRGDRRVEDHDFVDRIGLDAWPYPVPNGDRVVHGRFSVIFQQNCIANPAKLTPEVIATQPVNTPCWLNFFEVHCLPIRNSGEYEPSGPLRFSLEYSYAIARPTFRIWTHWLALNEYGLAIGSRDDTILFQADTLNNPTHAIAENVEYEFEYEIYSHDTDGFIKVWKDGVQIVNYGGREIGYGVERRPYPAARIYRAARTDTARLRMKIHQQDTYRVTLPGVTRGPELLTDGHFTLNQGRWSDQYSNEGCSVEWEATNGGRLNTFMTSPAVVGDQINSNCRLRRRLDILEIGETYELKSSGTFGLGAAYGDGSWWPSFAECYVPATVWNADGSELVRQFTAVAETVYLGGGICYPGHWLDGVSLKRVIS